MLVWRGNDYWWEQNHLQEKGNLSIKGAQIFVDIVKGSCISESFKNPCSRRWVKDFQLCDGLEKKRQFIWH